MIVASRRRPGRSAHLTAIEPRTPIGGLFLAGQDACAPGVTGALMGGVMAAMAIDPKVARLLR